MIDLKYLKKLWYPGLKETKKQIDEYNKQSELEHYKWVVAELVKEVDALKIELIEHLDIDRILSIKNYINHYFHL